MGPDQRMKRPKNKADLLWKSFHDFIYYRNIPSEFVICIWNTQHRKGEDLMSVFNIQDQPLLRVDKILPLYVEAMTLGLHEYDNKTIITNYNNFISRYEKLHRTQPLSETIPSPSWISR